MSLMISPYKFGFLGILTVGGKTYRAFKNNRADVLPELKRKAGIK